MTNLQLAKNYCKGFYKLESISEDASLFIGSVIGERKLSKNFKKTFSNWNVVSHRTAFVFQILQDGDITCIYNHLGGKYQNKETCFSFTEDILNQLSSYIINDN